MTPFSIPFQEILWNLSYTSLTLHCVINSLNNTTLEGSSSCPNVIILRLGTYQLRIARHQLAVIGVGNRAIRSSHVKISGRSSLNKNTRRVTRHSNGADSAVRIAYLLPLQPLARSRSCELLTVCLQARTKLNISTHTYVLKHKHWPIFYNNNKAIKFTCHQDISVRSAPHGVV